MTKKTNFLRRFRKLIAVACAIAWLCAFAASHAPLKRLPANLPSDKLLHFVGFLVLAGLLWLTFAAFGLTTARRLVLAVSISATYAAFDELTQDLVGRNTSLDDWIADMAGALAAIAACESAMLLGRLIARRGKNQTRRRLSLRTKAR